MTVLASDIGGTYSRFAVFEQAKDGRLRLQISKRCPTPRAGGFPQLVEQLAKSELAEWLLGCTRVAVAVPGPVHRGKALDLPNVSWSIERSQLCDCFPKLAETQVHLINDFAAQVLACSTSNTSDMICIQPGQENPSGVVSAIGAGTGLGFCSLVPNVNQYNLILPSEAGHQQFPFRGDRERSYEDFLLRATRRATIDANTVVSGQGLALLYEFVTKERLSPEDVATRLTPESEVSQMFAVFFARVAQSYVLSMMTTGCLYITGGVATTSRFLVNHDAFRAEFAASHSHGNLLSRIPIYLNVDADSGVWGAARYAVIKTDGRIRFAAD